LKPFGELGIDLTIKFFIDTMKVTYKYYFTIYKWRGLIIKKIRAILFSKSSEYIESKRT